MKSLLVVLKDSCQRLFLAWSLFMSQPQRGKTPHSLCAASRLVNLLFQMFCL